MYSILHIYSCLTLKSLGGKTRRFKSQMFPSTDNGVSVHTQTVDEVIQPSSKAPSTPIKGKTATPAPKHNKNQCVICNIQFESEADKAMNSDWIGCAKNKCPYWVHCRCAGIWYQQDQYKSMSKWAKDHFFCSAHYPKC